MAKAPKILKIFGDLFFQMMGVIAFVYLGDVWDTWLELKPTLPAAEMEFYADYYERTWIGTDSTPALFTPWMGNQHDNVLG